jgi:hypothetical protein
MNNQPDILKANVIEKYKDKIYTRDGNINLKTVKQIALAAGIKAPSVHRGPMDDLFIDYQLVDPMGSNAVEEVRSIYDFCLYLLLLDSK